jgi:hypothetical protein
MKLPACAEEYIKRVLKKMRYRRKVRRDVQQELTAHFEDELKDCKSEQDRQQKAQQLIAEFGDVKLLAVLLRRAKKRCRPLWQTAIVRSFQAVGIIVLYLFICSVPLFVGRPKINVNYLNWLNALVQDGRDETENARPYYEKAVALYVKNPQDWLNGSRKIWPTDMNDVELNVLSEWLQSNQAAINALREGSLHPAYWNEYQTNETKSEKGHLNSPLWANNFMDNTMEMLSAYKSLARAMRRQIPYEAHNGDIEKALSDCVTLTKFGGHLQGHGLLIEQLVGIAIEGLANSVTFDLLDSVAMPADILKNTLQKLNEQFDTQKPVLSLEAEKAFWYDQIQWAFTDDGQGNGRMLARGMPYVVSDDWKQILWRFVSSNYPDRKDAVTTIDKYFMKADELFALSPQDLQNEGIDANEWAKALRLSYMLKEQGPAQYRVGQISWRVKTGRQALLTVLAVMRYEKEKGRYPATLQELVKAGFLKKLPIDPYSNAPLVYKKTRSGFLIYSVGMNLKDDGGKLGLSSRGTPRMWADNGDWVFWPVPEK